MKGNGLKALGTFVIILAVLSLFPVFSKEVRIDYFTYTAVLIAALLSLDGVIIIAIGYALTVITRQGSQREKGSEPEKTGS